ncbi:unnamed protein product [Oncorhynchus mykiss]|uniref:Endonuclease/exonuclease/phosphatase domain-containing protein n=1 Tax=Oncorhynchus mykiss TaxID=8022 RepID=A0A061ACX1_ONCMY|nr:unnamed protein product [Oncorhynchus mykiss]
MPLTQGERVGVLFECLRQELSQVAPEETLVVGGDWNCTMDFTKDRNREEPHSVSVGVLKGIINQFDLVDVWRTKHPNTRQYTRVKVFGARVSAAQLDSFYIGAIGCWALPFSRWGFRITTKPWLSCLFHQGPSRHPIGSRM